MLQASAGELRLAEHLLTSCRARPRADAMPGSSSESAPAARAADVIDLDRFMRGVRPDRERLVVDGGGARRTALSTSSSGEKLRVPPGPAAHGKRFSHDSGLSDDSYTRHRRTRHRRVSAGDGRHVYGRDSGRSLRAFRASCERELRDQRRQLARVAALCERLAERRPEPEAVARPAPVSELSSSSGTTSDATRRDEHRAEECKTYKIIMTKLDELNRVFTARRAAGGRGRARLPPPPPAGTSDKIVATEYSHKTDTVQKTRRSTEMYSPRLVERAVGAEPWPNVRSPRTHIRDEHFDERSTRVSTLRAATPAFNLDNISRDVGVTRCPKLSARSIANYESSGDEPAGVCDPRCGFDLDNPVHLYAQAKRLQPRAAAEARAPRRPPVTAGGSSLCALCRGYWRSLRLYVAEQLCKNSHQSAGVE